MAAVEVALELEQERLDATLVAPVVRVDADRERRPVIRARARRRCRRRERADRAAPRGSRSGNPSVPPRWSPPRRAPRARAGARAGPPPGRRHRLEARRGCGSTRRRRPSPPDARRSPSRGAARRSPLLPRPKRKSSPATIDPRPDRLEAGEDELLRREAGELRRELDHEDVVRRRTPRSARAGARTSSAAGPRSRARRAGADGRSRRTSDGPSLSPRR